MAKKVLSAAQKAEIKKFVDSVISPGLSAKGREEVVKGAIRDAEWGHKPGKMGIKRAEKAELRRDEERRNLKHVIPEFVALLKTMPRLDDYAGFSRWQALWADDDEKTKKFDELLHKLYVDYAGMMRAWQTTSAPNGLCVARGLHGLVVPDKKAALDYVCAPKEDSDGNYSLSAAYSSSQFAALRPVWHLPDAEQAKGWLSSNDADDQHGLQRAVLSTVARQYVADQRLDPLAKSSKMPEDKEILTRVASVLQSSIMVLGRATPKQAYSFGGDSESGFMGEAEVYVKDQRRVIERVFVLSATPIDAPLATDRERREHALSWWNAVVYEAKGWFGKSKSVVYMHADAQSPASAKRVIEVREPSDHVFKDFGSPVGMGSADTVKDLGKPVKDLVGAAKLFKWYRVT